MTDRRTVRRRHLLLGSLIIMAAAALLCGRLPVVHALNFAVYGLDELASEADEAFVGTVLHKKATNAENHRYTLRVDIPLRGGLEKNEEVAVHVLQWAEDGVLDKGDSYLMLLTIRENGTYTVAGVHQGFIKLKNGTAHSRYYPQDEVDRYLERYGLKVKTIYERLVPEDKTASPFYSVRDATSPGMLWTAGLVLSAMLLWLFARASRRRKRAARTAEAVADANEQKRLDDADR